MNQPIATAVIKARKVKTGEQSLPSIMASLHRALRRRGVKGAIFDSCIYLPSGPDPATGTVRYDEPCWKLTAMGERYDDAGFV